MLLIQFWSLGWVFTSMITHKALQLRTCYIHDYVQGHGVLFLLLFLKIRYGRINHELLTPPHPLSYRKIFRYKCLHILRTLTMKWNMYTKSLSCLCNYKTQSRVAVWLNHASSAAPSMDLLPAQTCSVPSAVQSSSSPIKKLLSDSGVLISRWVNHSALNISCSIREARTPHPLQIFKEGAMHPSFRGKSLYGA